MYENREKCTKILIPNFYKNFYEDSNINIFNFLLYIINFINERYDDIDFMTVIEIFMVLIL